MGHSNQPTTEYQLSFEGAATIDGTPVEDGSVLARDVDEVTTDGPLAISISSMNEQHPDSTADMDAFQQLLTALADQATTSAEILDFLAVEFADIDEDEWAQTELRSDATKQTINRNARRADRHLSE